MMTIATRCNEADCTFPKCTCWHDKGAFGTMSKQIAELKTRERKLRDALSYAMDYMDNEQQHYFKTELWPELF